MISCSAPPPPESALALEDPPPPPPPLEGGATKVKAPARVLLPPGVVTTTSTAPAARAGVVTVTEVDERVPMVAATPARVTAVVPDRFVPVRVTEVPPLVVPAVGLSEVRVGGSW